VRDRQLCSTGSDHVLVNVISTVMLQVPRSCSSMVLGDTGAHTPVWVSSSDYCAALKSGWSWGMEGSFTEYAES